MHYGLGDDGYGFFSQSCGSTPQNTVASAANPLAPKMPHFAGKAKSVIYLHMAGAPSQLELFDYKPDLMKLDGKDCPPSFLKEKVCLYPWCSANDGMHKPNSNK
jgi:hypothetical protein